MNDSFSYVEDFIVFENHFKIFTLKFYLKNTFFTQNFYQKVQWNVLLFNTSRSSFFHSIVTI